MTRAAFLAQLQPLPANTSGQIRIVKYTMTRSGDVAVVVHQDAEIEDYHGQTLHATFFMTETWRDTADGWKLMLVHESNVLKDPPAIQLPPRALAAYAGTYRAGPDLTYVIALKNGALVGGREGAPAVPLLAELKDVLFVPGQPRTRKIFQRDAAGAVTGFLDRREGEDVSWKRVAVQPGCAAASPTAGGSSGNAPFSAASKAAIKGGKSARIVSARIGAAIAP